ncbi:putative E6 protein [Canis familiaris papillomavirus 13]|uniref:Protein E6 n=1 Tax=Canis familiaris papillomavirus 13 TaxID=1226723 RepID=J7JLS2_9PAPI|nr:putative E6 protein [Canis familiaris papillomavirus 13]AFQ52497.1 putative E6 protein [Canis familiaris papillomavirus 13]
MAAVAPSSIGDLSRFFGKPATDIRLDCIFCGNYLTNADKISFDWKALCVVWRVGVPFGVCTKCCEARAHEDCIKHTSCTLESDGVEAFTGKHLSLVPVRCRWCLGLLTCAEKEFSRLRRDPLFLVRKCWRGTCSACLCKQE